MYLISYIFLNMLFGFRSIRVIRYSRILCKTVFGLAIFKRIFPEWHRLARVEKTT